MTAASISDVPSSRSAEECEREFGLLAAQWHKETDFLSSMTLKITHPAYQRIMGMGSVALPLLLRELKHRPDHWFRALADVTGENPVPAGSKFEQARTIWLEWGRQRGHIE